MNCYDCEHAYTQGFAIFCRKNNNAVTSPGYCLAFQQLASTSDYERGYKEGLHAGSSRRKEVKP